jgi:three-Cys-motif partner protein
MKSPDYYRGREQTYLKHFFLERYLERVAYNIGSFANEFVYVDGFSGPWKSADESLDDTSFVIAIKQLRRVRDGLAKIGRKPRIRCLFIESNPVAYRALEAAIKNVTDIRVQSLNGEFEQSIPAVLQFIGRAFSLVFIDPTGWTGFGLKQITPILQHRPGEVLVNFMVDHINRFLDDPRPEIASSFAQLFGGSGWEAEVRAGTRREDAIVELYCERIRAAGSFTHVTSTRILKPTDDRAYFYLIYGTRHTKGLVEFRGVEKKAIKEQEHVRLLAKQESRVARTHQPELFAAASLPGGPPSFDEERALQRGAALARLRGLVHPMRVVPYEQVLATLLEMPLVWESDAKELIMELHDAGEIEVRGLKPRERTPKRDHVLVGRSGGS